MTDSVLPSHSNDEVAPSKEAPPAHRTAKYVAVLLALTCFSIWMVWLISLSSKVDSALDQPIQLVEASFNAYAEDAMGSGGYSLERISEALGGQLNSTIEDSDLLRSHPRLVKATLCRRPHGYAVPIACTVFTRDHEQLKQLFERSVGWMLRLELARLSTQLESQKLRGAADVASVQREFDLLRANCLDMGFSKLHCKVGS